VTNLPFVGFISARLPSGYSTSAGFFTQRGETHPGYIEFVISGARKLIEL